MINSFGLHNINNTWFFKKSLLAKVNTFHVNETVLKTKSPSWYLVRKLFVSGDIEFNPGPLQLRLRLCVIFLRVGCSNLI